MAEISTPVIDLPKNIIAESFANCWNAVTEQPVIQLMKKILTW